MTEGGETLTIQVVIQAVAQRRRAGMENRREEFLKTVCQIYMAAVLVVLPLYYIPGNGYDKLGDSKYYLYRNISLICMGICLAVQIIAVVRSCRMENSSSSGMYMRKTGGKIIRWCREHSVVTAVCLYGFCALLSAICSSYGRTAWAGEREWYMGAVTICLMLKGYVVGDWEYTHMLSTLGNNNWLSGYYSVMIPLSLSLFCKAAEEGRRAASIFLGGGNVLVVMLLFLQGSDGGVMVACVTLWICFWSSRKKNGIWEPLLVLLSGACVGMLLWGKVMQSRGTYDILLQDGIARKMAVWQGWFLLAVVSLLFCGIHYALPEKKKRALQIGALCGSLLLAAGVIIWYILKLQGSDFAEWGNRRGMLWQMAWQGFCRGDLKQKLLGAGPDCFAGYLEQVVPGGTVLFDKGYFAGSIFTNAHNEWLTTLINLGVLGTAAYAAVFLTALRKYRRNSMAIMLLFTYGMHSLISFQQVLNTPFFFLLLGVCEAEQRMNQQYNTDTHEESIEVG